ncbi:MAG TPA: TfoX/Sxy family protein [Tahibacter sp.]|nr:TfoX/Sxy family protein [Tahibacter sp.]
MGIEAVREEAQRRLALAGRIGQQLVASADAGSPRAGPASLGGDEALPYFRSSHLGADVMATAHSFVEYVAEQSRLEQRLSFKKMFGEYAVYLDGKVVAFACDNSLFIKPSAETARLTAELPQRPPYPGAKDYPVADQLLDEPDELRALLLATERAMPAPKAKAVAKGKARPEAQPAAKTKAKPASKAKAAAKVEAAPKARTVPKAKAVTKTGTASKAKAASTAAAMPKAGTRAASATEAGSKGKAASNASRESKAKAGTVSKAKTAPKAKAASKAKPVPKAKNASKPKTVTSKRVVK